MSIIARTSKRLVVDLFNRQEPRRLIQRQIASSSLASPPPGTTSSSPATVSPASSSSSTLKITEKCKQRLKEILDQGDFLRVSVEGGGCSGFQYKFDVDNQMGSDDIVVHSGGEQTKGSPALVVIDQMSLDIIRGSTLDYETELIRSAFRIVNNPHAEQGCSCGASFNMKI